MPCRIAVSLALFVVSAVMGQVAAVRNGDFGAGLVGWEEQAAATDLGAGALDPTTGQDGNGSLRITHRDSRSRTSFVQTMAVQPRQEYVAAAWLKEEDVSRRGVGAQLLVGDSEGRVVARAVPSHIRQGSFDWVRVSVRFASGPRTSVSLALALHDATGTVWFDGVSLAPAPAWAGPSGPPPDLPPPTILMPLEARDYRTVRSDVATPCWAFGKPLGRRLRVGVLAPVQAQREAVELAQRLDCDVVPLMVHSGASLGTSGFARGALSRETALANLKERLKEDYDALIIGRVSWGALTEEINRDIIEKTRAGMGLIYVCPEGQRLSPDHPMFQPAPMPVTELAATGLAGLPSFESVPDNATFLARHVQPFFLGEGRMLVVDYGKAAPSDHHYLTPPTRRWRGGYTHYDLYMAFLGKAVRWVTVADSGTFLTELSAPKQVQWGETAALACTVRGTMDSEVRVELRVRRLRPSPWDPPLAMLSCQASGPAAMLPLPTRLPIGDYVAMVVVRDGPRCLDWGWVRFEIRGPVALAQLDLPDRTLPGSSASIPVAMRLEGLLPEGAKVRFEVHDAYDRLVGKQEQTLASRVLRTDVSCAFSRSIYNRLTIHVLDSEGTPLLCRDAEFTIPRPRPYDAFQFIMTGDGGDDYIGFLLRRQAARSGVDGAIVALGDEEARPLTGDERHALRGRLMALVRDGIAPVPRVSGLTPVTETAAGAREPCLSDPEFRHALESSLDERVNLARPFSPLAVSMGTEGYLAQAAESCLSPSSAAAPVRRRDLAGPGDWSRWVDWRRDRDRVFSEACGFGRDIARRTILGARVGCGHLLADTPVRGYDWEQFGKSCSLLTVRLDDPGQVDLLRSFTSSGTLRGGWFGGYSEERREPAWQRWAPWKLMFAGLNSAWFHAPYAAVGGNGEVGFRPDLSPYACWGAAASEIDRLRRGIDRLLLTAERDDRAIALVYSRSSALVSTLDADCDDHLAALAAMGELLRDTGFSYRIVAESALEDGAVLRAECQAVFLPACVALSDKAGKGLRQFAESGGVVVADWGTGRYDEHGKLRGQGAVDELFGLHRSAGGEIVSPPGGIPGLLPQATLDGGIRIRNAWPKRFVGGVPILITSEHGSGVAVYLNFSLIDYPANGGARGAALQTWLRQLLAREGMPEPVVPKGQWGAPHRVETCRWRNGDLRFIGLLKHPETPQVGEDLQLPLPEDLYAYDVLEGSYLGSGKTARFHLGPGEAKLISLDPERVKSVEIERLKGDEYLTPAYRITVKKGGRAVQSDRVVHIRVFDPAGFRYPAATVTLLAPGGVCEYDVPFGLGAPAPGRWRLEATDAATGIRSEVAFKIRPKD